MAAARTVALVVLVSVFPAAVGAMEDPTREIEAKQAPIEEELELFRQQVLDYLQRMDGALSGAMQHPALTQRIESALAANMLQIPFAPSTYEIVGSATSAELTELRQAFVQAPDAWTIPEALAAAVEALPHPPPPAEAAPRAVAAACQDNYTEYANVISKQDAVRGLTRALDSTAFLYSILNTFTEVVGAATEDVPYVGKVPALPLVIIRGIFDAVRQAMSFARDDLSFQGQLSSLCLASCLADTADLHGQPSEFWRGRGCDNRDNNCTDGIDDADEDLYPPVVSFDAAVIAQCFADTTSAQAAAELAVKARDDCSEPTFTVALGPPSPATCQAAFSVMAQDDSGNPTHLVGSHLRLTVDGTAPQVTVPALGACYPTIDAARDVLTGPGFAIADCTDVEVATKIVEKECVADLELTAVDACGNQTAVRRSVRVDASSPEIDVAPLEIPSIDGLSCFESRADAITAVREATTVSDRCTAAEDLIRDTTASGTECNLTVTSRAEDECGRASTDSLLVRVDPQAPVVSCSVATTVLYPQTNAFVDVGFSFTASDNCEPDGPQVDVEVTSDEPTVLAYTAVPGLDPFPDAVVERGTAGTVQRILLRSQRSTEGKADGRVYRIRVTATDSCGLQSSSDCYVTVPRTKPGPGSAINSDQKFDATQFN